MSVYVPVVWRNGQDPYINAFNLNHLENGVKTAHEEIEQLVDGTIKVKAADRADTATTVDVATQTTVGGAKIWVDESDPNNVIGYIDSRG